MYSQTGVLSDENLLLVFCVNRRAVSVGVKSSRDDCAALDPGLQVWEEFVWGIIYSWFSRLVPARGSCTDLVTVNTTKVSGL